MIREHGIALLTSIYVNAHLKEGEKPRPETDFMLFAPPKPPVIEASPARAVFQERLEKRRRALAARGLKTR